MRRGFTLIELLIVTIIIAVLAGVLIPSLHRARQQAYQVVCASTLKTIGAAVVYYAHDRTNGNGFLPQLSTAEMVSRHPGFYWTNQLTPYMKVTRGSGFFRCPADREPSYRFITGNRAGLATTRAMTFDRNVWVEPVSYAGSCDTLVNITTPSGRMDRQPRKLVDLDTPGCTVLMADTLTDLRFCWTWDQIVREHDTRQPSVRRAYRRHYGRRDDNTNGPNWLFADGHTQWHSIRFAARRLICCQDFGNVHPAYARMAGSRIERARACGGDQVGERPVTRRGR